jgi:hypothetical protein
MAKKHRPTAANHRPQPTNERWRAHFFRRHIQDDPRQSVPAREFLDRLSPAVAAKLIAVVRAVVDAPPPAFSGGGKWEAMHDDMQGYYEVRVDGPQRRHYRLFCLLERNGASVGLGGPSLVVITGLDKAFRTVLSPEDYASVRRLGSEYQRRNPRSVLV